MRHDRRAFGSFHAKVIQSCIFKSFTVPRSGGRGIVVVFPASLCGLVLISHLWFRVPCSPSNCIPGKSMSFWGVRPAALLPGRYPALGSLNLVHASWHPGLIQRLLRGGNLWCLQIFLDIFMRAPPPQPPSAPT